MPAELALAAAPSPLWRVERTESALRFSRLNPVDAMSDRAGNRFDVPGAGVLYGASTPEGAFAETLAGFRTSASMMGQLARVERDPGRVGPGQVPSSWLETRRLRTFDIVGSLPFVDVESPRTHTYLTRHAAPVLLHHGLENLDVAGVRGPSRLLTRAIAAWLYSRTDVHGLPLYAGIRYVSRLGDFECWAVFDGTPIELRATRTIPPTERALGSVLRTFAMTLR